MSYEISLHKIVNDDIGLCTFDETEACKELLSTVNSEPFGQSGCLILKFEDGSAVEFSAWDDDNNISSCTFFTRGISQVLLKFIYDMAVAGNFVILDTGASDTPENPLAIMVSSQVLKSVGTNSFEHPKLCHDYEELGEILGVDENEQAFGGPLVFSSIDSQVKPKIPSLLRRIFFNK